MHDESKLVSSAYDPIFRAGKQKCQKVLSSTNAIRNGDPHLLGGPPRPMARFCLEPDQQRVRVLGV